MVAKALLIALAVRSLSLALPQTFFQPDEYYQALEPAHNLVFGNGYLSWEWRDLALPADADLGNWWTAHVVGGRMRSWLWPGVFALVYKLLQVTGLDRTELLTLAPRVVGVLVASLTDYYTSRLASKLLGPGASAAGLFLSLTSLFNAHLLPRALSTSPETLLVTIALVYFPLGSYEDEVNKAETNKAETATKSPRRQSYVEMDRMSEPGEGQDNFSLAVVYAALALCIRPTTAAFWAYLGLEQLLTVGKRGILAVFSTVLTALAAFTTVTAASTAVDYLITGRLYLPMLTFVHQNIVKNVSSFYGATDPFYHLVQSLPILLFPIWYWWAQGFFAALLPDRVLPASLLALDRPQGLRVLSRALTFAILILSLSPHSEWRFLHPLLPPLLIFALVPLFQAYKVGFWGRWPAVGAVRQYLRLPKKAFYLCLLAPIVPWVYLNAYHGRAQVQVMNVLRRGELGEVSGVIALMPCHSTPWSSHLHHAVEGYFLACEPPIEESLFDHTTQQAMFYDTPVAYLREAFPVPLVPLHRIAHTKNVQELPSHVLLFGSLLDVTEQVKSQEVTVRDALRERGYDEVWSMWNGYDLAQDEPERRGGVRVWRLVSRRP